MMSFLPTVLLSGCGDVWSAENIVAMTSCRIRVRDHGVRSLSGMFEVNDAPNDGRLYLFHPDFSSSIVRSGPPAEKPRPAP
jgi:hypothetical protein